MQFHHADAQVYIPDDVPLPAALRRITHLGVGAHQDDLEFMAFHGILAGYRDRRFGGVTCTDGRGSARTGPFAGSTDEQMVATRHEEQNAAARIGRYAVMIQLKHPSRAVKSATDTALQADLLQILAATRPQVVYTHNLADKHDTHVGVAVATIQALRELPAADQPRQVLGCEIWRSLDWLPDRDKVLLDVSGHEALASQLHAAFASQIAGGKQYDLAVQGRRRANATFLESHAVDAATQVSYAMDLTPLVLDPGRDILEYVCGFVDRLRADIRDRVATRLGR